ncbi:hypothetical protein E5676_scaffold236G001180 [Cucumis melo var. makuwa]|uniref:Ty3-gypsy retrotransposon protein n=1 Tax=Cucumis melo var. makuwa TaxID=1194695 RepID=A0A5A7VKE9_CUCMM|nr:hypothetical protein E6C27_scaffold550G00090 [Cucumis melo var. makuwa]TYK27232.1 hypothetical protein E5676_scaffold236G001180 [Cucumis melo var. makuwa]
MVGNKTLGSTTEVTKDNNPAKDIRTIHSVGPMLEQAQINLMTHNAEDASSTIAEMEFKRLAKKGQEKMEKVRTRLLKIKDEVCTASTLHRVIAIHKNKARLKCLKTKQAGQIEVKVVDDKDEEEESEEDNVPLKCKRQGEEEALGSKKAKTSKAKDSKDTLPHASTTCPKKKKPTTTFSPIKSKFSKAKTSQTLSSPEESNQKIFQDTICDPTMFIDDVFKESEEVTLSDVVSPKGQVLDEVVTDPLQEGNQQNAKMKEAVREDELEVDEDYTLKVDNANTYSLTQIEGLRAKMNEVKMQNQELKTSALRHLHAAICSIKPLLRSLSRFQGPLRDLI